MPQPHTTEQVRRLTRVRDTAAATERPAGTVTAVWLWDDARDAIVWVGAGLLDLLGLADLAALRADPVYALLAAASRRLKPGDTTDLLAQRGPRVLLGALSGTRVVLMDGAPGLRVAWTLAAETPPEADSGLQARAFAAAPVAMAVVAADGVPLVTNEAFAAVYGHTPRPVDPAALGGTVIPLDAGGLRLVCQLAPVSEAAVVETGALARIAHEFRSPLTAVLGFAEFLHATLDDLPPERARAYLADLATAAERMRRLADDLVALGNGPAGLRIAETPLDALLATALRLAEPAAAARGVALDGPKPSGLIALADADALGRAVANLLDNAIRHGAIAGETVQLGLTDHGRGLGATIEVADDGPGLSPEALAEALAPYGRPGPRADQTAGGLGLPIVQEIAEAHGARFEIDTAPNRGLRARIHLPGGRVFRAPSAR